MKLMYKFLPVLSAGSLLFSAMPVWAAPETEGAENAAGLYECPLKTATRHIDHETVMRLLSSILKGN